jgi:hypothetical protein
MLCAIHREISATRNDLLFLLKSRDAREIQKDPTNTLVSDVYSQAQISRSITRFSTGDISYLDEARPGRLLSILGFEPSLGHFLEKFLFASARTIAMHFTV